MLLLIRVLLAISTIDQARLVTVLKMSWCCLIQQSSFWAASFLSTLHFYLNPWAGGRAQAYYFKS
jgi:hypothetical protein